MKRGIVHIPVLLLGIFVILLIVLISQNKILKNANEKQDQTETTNPTQSPEPSNSIEPSVSTAPSPIPTPKATDTKTSKILLLIYNPTLESQGGKNLVQYKGWNDPNNLTQSFIKSVKEASGGYVNYQIGSTIEIDGYPVKGDGFSYTDDSYLSCLSNPSSCHNPDLADYSKMIEDSRACEKLNSGEINELWIWGGPYFGYWESNLAGPGAFWYNSNPTTNTNCSKLLPIMGFNYERGEAEMFEDLGHRLESTMTKVYGSWSANESTPWNKFSLLDYDSSGRGGCGNAHLAVNASSNQGYDRTNSRSVYSSCEDFLNYPNFTGQFTNISCSNWGCTTLGYFKWWFGHVPKPAGASNGKLNNWWEYLINPQKAI